MRDLVKMIIETIAQTSSVEKIILYGSRARGDNEPRSDYDIAIIAPTISEREWLDLYFRVDDIETLYQISLVLFEEASPEKQDNIKKDGIILYDRS